MVHWAIDKSLRIAMVFTIITAGIIGILSAYNLFYNVIPYPQSVEESFKHPLLGWYLSMAALIATTYGLKSSRNFLVKHFPWRERVDEKINNLERGIKPDVYYSFNYAKKMKEIEEENTKNTKSFKNNLLGLLIVGVILILFGLFIYFTSTIDREAYQTWEGINTFISKNFTRTTLNMNFILNDNESLIGIYYNTNRIYNNTFFAIEIPYEGKLREGKHGWISLPMDNDATLIYKQFLCIPDYDNCTYHSFEDYDRMSGNDGENLVFDISKPIDAKQFYTHSLNIPVGGGIQGDISEYIQFEIDDKGVYSWDSYWHNIDFQLSVSLPDEATEINLIPSAHPTEQNFESQNQKRTVYSWKVPNIPTSFHADYVIPSERAIYQTHNALGIALIGGGISIVAVFFGEMINRKRS